MPNLPALIDKSARRALAARGAQAAIEAHAPVAVYRPVPGPALMAADQERCLACAEWREHGPDGRWAVAVAYVEIPAWYWTGPVCARHLDEARDAARTAGERCHIRPVSKWPPPRPGEVYRAVPRQRERREPPKQPNTRTIEISGDYGR